MVSSQGYVLPVNPWYNKDIEQYPYDPDKRRNSWERDLHLLALD